MKDIVIYLLTKAHCILSSGVFHQHLQIRNGKPNT